MRIETDLPATIRRRPRGLAEKLRAALLNLASGQAEIAHHTEKNWASITFAGTRHRFTIVFDGAEAVETGEHFIAALPDHEFTLHGHIVADAGVVAVDHRIDPARMELGVELLVLDDC